ncbi:hypothetical protein Pse7367_1299 [Thalassoporum mexicanum PCC 7367]|uniref:hypothetical protein n=1 Tax=Thalassoporum mexicanum TaxID=3457544 RepID=UPI00029FE496|nr:hypothetical protein [Pseudanabaena sp. PCC 7367]AFY69593.1 hypothetical protein Pse7367_1299 [Pseudanabaena sp. PCC 7367]
MDVDKGSDKDTPPIYDDDDREVLMSLLEEYSNKLLRICEELNKLYRNANLLTLTFAFVSPIIFVTSLSYVRVYPLMYLVLFSCCFIMILLGAYINARSFNLQKKRGQNIYYRLSKIIRIISQLQEHVESRVSRKLELDFRLADAEVALEEFKRFSGKNLIP